MPFVTQTPYTAQNTQAGQMGTPSAYGGMDFPPPTPSQTSQQKAQSQGLPSDYYNVDSPNFLGPSSQSGSSGGGMDMSQMFDMAKEQAQLQKIMADYQAQVKMARFMLPQTLKQIGSQFGAQGDYYSSGRRRTQQEAIVKTRYDLAQAKREVQLQQQMMQLDMAKQMMGMSGGG